MAAVAGLRGTGDWGTDERPKNFREMILWRDPNGKAPLTALMSKMRKRPTDDAEFAWFEEELNAWRGQLNGAITTTTTTAFAIDSGDAKELKAGDLLLVESAENVDYDAEVVMITTTPTTTTGLTVTRGALGTTAATISDNVYLTKIGSIYAEGTASPDATSRNPTKYYNYTQIFKDAYELTGTAEQTKLRTGDPVANDKKRKMFDHAAAEEYAWIFGKRWEGTGSNGKPMRGTGGLLYFLALAYDAGNTHCMKIWTTAATESTYLDAVYKLFDYNTVGGGGGNERIVFCGNGYLNTLNKVAKAESSSRVNFSETIKYYGMELEKWRLPQGTLYFKTHPLFNTHSRFTNSAIYIDPGAITYRPMKNRDTKFKDNIQNNDEDTRKGQWMTEAGIEFTHMKGMSYHGAFQ